jgi:hypothetical protein
MITRLALLTTLMLTMLPLGASAGQPARTVPPREAAPAVADERSARETRDRLHEVLDQYPPSVAQVLRLDPSLLTKPDYVSPYPSLATFLAQHPEVAHNPTFFLGEARLNGADGNRKQALDALEEILAGIGLFLAFLTMVSVVIWLVRTGVEYRRWLRATKIQTDAHMKVVDRLASNEDLMVYMQSPAGQRFLSSSPVAIDATPQAVSAPLNRILWSVQAGVVLAAAGTGLWFARFNVVDEAAQPLYVIAILAIALGVGFVVSALLSYGLSRQLGLLNTDSTHA